MFGFIFGALCLGGLAALFMHRPRGFHRGRGCSGYRHHGFGRYGLNAILERLDTTPGQEKAIIAALEELRDEAGETRAKFFASRRELGAAIRAEHFDAGPLEDMLGRHVADLSELGSRAIQSLSRIHEVLDKEQRARLARMIEHGPGWGFSGVR